MLFLFRSAPEVEKRIHSKLFRKFWRSRGTKEPAYITLYVSSLTLAHENFLLYWTVGHSFLVLLYRLENWTVRFQSHSLWQCGATKSTFHSQDYFSPGHPFHKRVPLIFLLNSFHLLLGEVTLDRQLLPDLLRRLALQPHRHHFGQGVQQSRHV